MFQKFCKIKTKRKKTKLGYDKNSFKAWNCIFSSNFSQTKRIVDRVSLNRAFIDIKNMLHPLFWNNEIIPTGHPQLRERLMVNSC